MVRRTKYALETAGYDEAIKDVLALLIVCTAINCHFSGDCPNCEHSAIRYKEVVALGDA